MWGPLIRTISFFLDLGIVNTSECAEKVTTPGSALSGRPVMPEVSGVLGNSWARQTTLCSVPTELAVENDLQIYTSFFTSEVIAGWLGS